MYTSKTDILNNICYTELVYQRINLKLDKKLSKVEIEKMILEIIKETLKLQFKKIGKNIYITNFEKNIRLTINSNTCRIITADCLDKMKNKIIDN